MTYNKKKINTKGEKAPNGYHYMADDSLMSDEEHEKIYGKSFVPVSKTHCNDDYKSFKAGPGFQWIDIKVWEICLLDAGEAVFVYDLITQTWTWSYPNSTQTNNTMPSPWIGYFGFSGCPLNTAAGVTSWPPGAGGNSNYNMTQKGLAAQAWYDWVVQETGPVNIGDQVEVDMTGKPPFGSPGNWPDGVWPTGMCAIAGVQDVNKICFIYRGEISYQYIQNGSFWGGPYMNLGRNCCEGFYEYPIDPPPPKPNGWDCEITAYQSKAPYAPIYSCVQKYFPQVGAFQTQQACLASNCGSPQLVTIQCSQCNNGSAVSNVFQGTTCPPGWQPTSLGDPCKPPTGPTPIDPVLSTPRVPGSTSRTDSSSY